MELAAVGVVVVLALSLVFGVILPRHRRRLARSRPIAIVRWGEPAGEVIPPRPTRVTPPEATPATESTTSAAPVASAAAMAPPPPSAPAIPVEMQPITLDQVANEDRLRVRRRHVAGDRRDATRETSREPARESTRDSARDERSAVTLRLERPNDGTLQFLPGRLEIVEGRDTGQEVKFVRTAGPDGTTITFGRAEGAQYRHVQLHEPTVSRMHAKLSLDGKSWTLTNLSATNPVVVNGLALAGEGSTVVLREGDRIEMGEVVFRFRAK